MNKTEHYDLNQWELHDRVMMQDFNADNAKLDAALKAEADARAAETAAREAAGAVLNTQLGKRGNCRVETWQYLGAGTYSSNNPSTLTFSDVPEMAVILGTNSFAFVKGGVQQCPCMSMNQTNSGVALSTLHCTWQGNTLNFYASTEKQQMNVKGHTYQVIAFYAEDKA